MAVSSNQKVAELARIAYLALLHPETELGEEANTFDGDKWADKLRGIRLEILAMFSDTESKVNLDKAIYLIGNEGFLVAYYHGSDTKDPDERLAKITRSSTSSDLDLAQRRNRHYSQLCRATAISG
jgi:hypothetical protein